MIFSKQKSARDNATRPLTCLARNGRNGLMKHPLFSVLAVLALGVLGAVFPNHAQAADDEVAVIKTSLGTMVVEFYPEVAPKHVESFKNLAKKGFYDGTAFHRVIPGFMIQGGDPNTKDESKKDTWGTGGPGYNLKAEFNDKKHVRGTLSMARSQSPDSAGSQFFICHGAPSFLNGKYTVFGQLIKGDEVLDKIANTKTEPPDRPVTRVNIDSIKIVPRAEATK
jgi:peptidyl-prolyl cis-trans isomerase B (cyclophilin B)